MLWQERLWADIYPHLPPGRVGLWAAAGLFTQAPPTPVAVLLEAHSLNSPKLPHGAALQGLVMVGAGIPATPWPNILASTQALLAPQAPLLLLAPRQGLLRITDPSWHSPNSLSQWHALLHQAGFTRCSSYPLAGNEATAAAWLLLAHTGGGPAPTKVQFKRKVAAGTAAATGCC